MNRQGDWNCRACQHRNFQRRDSCQRCGGPKPGEYGRNGFAAAGFDFTTGQDVRPETGTAPWVTVGPTTSPTAPPASSAVLSGMKSAEESTAISGGPSVSEAAAPAGNPVTGFAPDLDVMSTTSRVGLNASGAVRPEKRVEPLCSDWRISHHWELKS